MIIKKDDIKIYLAAIGIYAAVRASLLAPEFICNHTKHSEKICPLTRVEMLFGTKENAIYHQLHKSKVETGEESTYGILKKNSFQYEAEKSNISNETEKNTYYNVNDEGQCVKVNISILTENLEGILTGDDFVALDSCDDNIISDESVDIKSKYFADVALMEVDYIDYIGPVDKDYPNSIILEDRDGNRKRVSSSTMSGELVKEIFKTFYYDAEVGYYKIDEDAFTECMQNLVATQISYVNQVVYWDEETHRQVFVTPKNGVLMDNGLVRISEQINPYPDFSFYSFESKEAELENDTNVRKLTK